MGKKSEEFKRITQLKHIKNKLKNLRQEELDYIVSIYLTNLLNMSVWQRMKFSFMLMFKRIK